MPKILIVQTTHRKALITSLASSISERVFSITFLSVVGPTRIDSLLRSSAVKGWADADERKGEEGHAAHRSNGNDSAQP